MSLAAVLDVSAEWLKTGAGKGAGRNGRIDMDDPVFRAAFMLFEQTYLDLGIVLQPRQKAEANYFFCKDAMVLGPTAVTQERTERFLRFVGSSNLIKS